MGAPEWVDVFPNWNMVEILTRQLCDHLPEGTHQQMSQLDMLQILTSVSWWTQKPIETMPCNFEHWTLHCIGPCAHPPLRKKKQLPVTILQAPRSLPSSVVHPNTMPHGREGHQGPLRATGESQKIEHVLPGSSRNVKSEKAQILHTWKIQVYPKYSIHETPLN